MYCSNCATPLTPGLSYCNRCGASLKEPQGLTTTSVAAYLTAVTTVAIAGLGFMLGGTVALKIAAQLNDDFIGMFLFMSFLIVFLVEFSLLRQLSRVSGSKEKRSPAPPRMSVPPDFRPTADPRELQARSLTDQVPSVTENTTRTLDYSHNEPRR